MKREIIFPIKDTYEYRIVAKFGYHHVINLNWWCYLEKRVVGKKWLFFGDVEKWVEVDRCWFSNSIETLEDLEKSCMKLYDENVLIKQRLINKAMSL